MRYKLLGRSGLRVSELCLGTMTFGEDWGWGAAKEDCARMVEAFAEAGGNFIDTANIYTGGSSEKITGELIAAERERWVLATKYTCSTDTADPNRGGSHRKNMVQAVDASLRALGTDYIDVYWVHVWDVFTPVEEVMRGLDDLVRSGKVLYAGISDTPAWIVSQANMLADLRGWTPFVGLQVPYSLVERAPERELLPMAASLDLTVAAWGPLGAGLLTGTYGSDRQASAGRGRLAGRIATHGAERILTPQALAAADAVNKIAADKGVTSTQVAIAWVRAQQERAVIVPIIGARTAGQLTENLGALQVVLSDAELKQLDEASHITLGFPHDFPARAIAYGDTYQLVDSHRPHIWPDL
jgi:aryl-alcohol dehydrogenase-like predicted oxidoreductase